MKPRHVLSPEKEVKVRSNHSLRSKIFMSSYVQGRKYSATSHSPENAEQEAMQKIYVLWTRKFLNPSQ